MSFPFFMTWSKQKNASSFNITSNETYCFRTPEGKEILDMSSTSYQASFGLKNSEICQAISNQLKEMPVTSPKAIWPNKINTTKKLLIEMNLGEGKIFYTNSGSEAIENALKIARLVKKKNIVLSRRKSYHGATLGAVSITGDWRHDDPSTVDQWSAFIPEPDDDPNCEATEKIIVSLYL